MFRTKKWIVAAGLCLLCFQVVGQKKPDPWDSFAPPPDKRNDWIQLTSGEWLKGDLKVMYNFNLEFDSDELDLLELDFEDVQQIRTRRRQAVLVQTGHRETEVMRGRLVMDGEKVQLVDGEKVAELKRTQVISIAGSTLRERDRWSGMFSIGATARGGNTETLDVTAIANLRRRTARSRFNADYISNYSTAKGIQTANNQRLSGYYDWFLTSRFYWKVLAGEYYRDSFSNIDNQYSLSTGVGYDLVRTTKTEWTFGGGVGYQEQQFVSVEAGKDDSASSVFGTIGTRCDTEITGNLDFLYDYSARFLNGENGRYTHHMLATLSFEFIGDLDLDFSVVWDHIRNPQTDADGNVPEQDDYQLVVALAYDF